METVGIIGTGATGSRMAKRLLAHGLEVVIYDIDGKTIAPLAAPDAAGDWPANPVRVLIALLAATHLIGALREAIITSRVGAEPDMMEAINASSGQSHVTAADFPRHYIPPKLAQRLDVPAALQP